MKLTPAMRACLAYYRDNEHNPNRVQKPPYAFTTRQVNRALELGFLCVGKGGWHIPTEAGRALLSQETDHG